MKRGSFFILLFLFSGMLEQLAAQNLQVRSNGKDLAKDTVAFLTSFSGKFVSGKTYLKWTVANERNDGLYLVYRSEDGIKYQLMGSKPGIGVPISKDMAYYFVDEVPVSEKSFYRVILVEENNKFLQTDRVTVEQGRINFAKCDDGTGK